ncbi:MAG: type I DNA topoisomerase [bacterium]|nr:type I DNA topoisomerase [bacterium]
MSKSLVIVESPAKAKTIEKYLGSGYKVLASFGHVRDLPKSKLGVDVKKNFEPTYIVPTKAKKVLASLKSEAEKSEKIYLATDFDREGEAIAWHIMQATGSQTQSSIRQLADKTQKYGRVTFHEITKEAIVQAFEHPREIDMDLVDAQQARRVLDRLVGYKLSPFLWRKVYTGLSAGRVQSVAVRLVVDREREIEAFKVREYWTIEAIFSKKPDKIKFGATLTKIDDKPFKEVDQKKLAEDLVKDIEGGKYSILDIQKAAKTRSPAPPFSTSTLQQEANRKLRFSAKQTMTLAQHLYEGVDLGSEGSAGLITYMRTDSYNLAESAIREARQVIGKEFGKEYVPQSSRLYKTKAKGAQEAHEAIRPTLFSRTPDSVRKFLDSSHYKLYKLIWERAIASQMADAQVEETVAQIESKGASKVYVFTAKGAIVTFAGFLKVHEEGRDEIEEDGLSLLPDLEVGESVHLENVDGRQHFTQPPGRYTEATLVKELEKRGIGRPSTYAPIMSTIVDRGYVQKLEGRFHPQDVGLVVTDLLTEHFPAIVDYQFTAKMEEELDDIAEGKLKWQPVVKEFYEPLAKTLDEKMETVEKKDITEEKTDEKCPECKKDLVIKLGRFGKFYACSGYPECEYTRPYLENEEGEAMSAKEVKELTDEKCPKCGAQLAVKQGRFGKFLGCSEYPKCHFTKQIGAGEPVKCTECAGEIVMKRTRRGKPFWGCSNYPKCTLAFWNEPVDKRCPKCKAIMVKSGKDKVKCSKCEYEETANSS